MSDVLTPETPEVVAAVPEAPATPEAVEAASAGTEPKVVPVERFNGLQSKYQTDKTEWEQREAIMKQELESLRQAPKEEPMSEDVSELKDQVSQLTNLLMSERTESARQAVLDAYPEAKPFADLIVGDSTADMEQVAKTIHERMLLLKGDPAPDPDPTAAASAETAPPVLADGTEAPPVMPEHGAGGSGGALSPAVSALADAQEDAIRNKDFDGFLNAAWALQDSQSPVG